MKSTNSSFSETSPILKHRQARQALAQQTSLRRSHSVEEEDDSPGSDHVSLQSPTTSDSPKFHQPSGPYFCRTCTTQNIFNHKYCPQCKLDGKGNRQVYWRCGTCSNEFSYCCVWHHSQRCRARTTPKPNPALRREFIGPKSTSSAPASSSTSSPQLLHSFSPSPLVSIAAPPSLSAPHIQRPIPTNPIHNLFAEPPVYPTSIPLSDFLTIWFKAQKYDEILSKQGYDVPPPASLQSYGSAKNYLHLADKPELQNVTVRIDQLPQPQSHPQSIPPQQFHDGSPYGDSGRVLLFPSQLATLPSLNAPSPFSSNTLRLSGQLPSGPPLRWASESPNEESQSPSSVESPSPSPSLENDAGEHKQKLSYLLN